MKEHFEKDYAENAHDVDENVFIFEDHYTTEIFDAHYNLAPYGKSFEKLKFSYTGTVTKYDEYNRILYIDNRPFRTFIYSDYLPEQGKQVNIIFSTVRLPIQKKNEIAGDVKMGEKTKL